MPFDGVNPHSVVILDNCSIHHNEVAVQMIQQVGAIVHFLPPYSPDYNPIEEAFSRLKTEMKAMEEAQVTDIEIIVLPVFLCISQWLQPVDQRQFNLLLILVTVMIAADVKFFIKHINLINNITIQLEF